MVLSDIDAEEILNLEEASRYLRIKRRTLYTLAARGVVPAAKIGGQWRFRKSQLERLFEAGQPAGPPSAAIREKP
ncbi:MAG TPA: helix-turn-helix domain-containing protein [Candidatus Methylomirabilis sp.]|nr:helix-turn-helix domain-containing protein [Candidatus Methylomirabilis sp.]